MEKPVFKFIFFSFSVERFELLELRDGTAEIRRIFVVPLLTFCRPEHDEDDGV